ncbi:hypothetical protein KM043_008983 [Ampulex compressa]|nr:hypothetical protein KM043_008983 [Ampulex compressa]
MPAVATVVLPPRNAPSMDRWGAELAGRIGLRGKFALARTRKAYIFYEADARKNIGTVRFFERVSLSFYPEITRPGFRRSKKVFSSTAVSKRSKMEVEPMSTFYPHMTFYVLSAFVVILIGIYYYMTTSRMFRMGNKLPGPPTIPILGNAHMTLTLRPEDAFTFIIKHDIHGDVTRVFFLHRLFIFITHPQDIEIILSSHVHIDKSVDYRYFKPWLGDGLLINTGDKWRHHRKIIAPSFHQNVLKTFVPLFYKNSVELVRRLRSEVGKEINIHDHLSAVTVDILVETAMGVRGIEKHRTGHEYATAVMKMCDIIHQRQYNLLMKIGMLYKALGYAAREEKFLNLIHGLSNRIIRMKKEEVRTINETQDEKAPVIVKRNIENVSQKYTEMRYVKDDLDDIEDNDVGEKKRLAFLELLLQLGNNDGKLSDEEIEEEVNTIMFEGHDTTAAGSSFVLALLGVHRDVQERVYEELNDIFQGSDRECTFQDTLEMKYLERVILESLRLFPPVPAIARELKQDVQIVTNNYVLPRGSTVVVAPIKTHRMEEFYPNPDKFDPDNFLPENMSKRHYYAFIPFSAGPRSCVGRKYAMLKLKVLLSTVLRNYKITSSIQDQDFQLRFDIILKRNEGFPITMEPRQKTNLEIVI